MIRGTVRPIPAIVTLAALGLAASTSACAPQDGTAIVVSITGEPVTELLLQVAVEREVGDILVPGLSGQRIDVRGRDLRASPYELRIHRQQLESPAPVRVLAEGFQNDLRSSLDITEPPVAFVDGQVVRRTLELQTIELDTGGVTTWDTGCITVTRQVDGKEQIWVLGVENDQDCDGFTSDGEPADCDDTDPAVNPYATEICDGKDNDCDGMRLPPGYNSTVSCYGAQQWLCREGTRSCDDQTGNMEACQTEETDRRVAQAYCDAYDACTSSSSDPWACAQQAVQLASGSCTVEGGNKDASVCAGRVKLDPPTPSASANCRWDLIDRGELPLGLAEGENDPHGPVAFTCSPYLVIAPADQLGVKMGKVVLEFFGEPDAPSVVIEIGVQVSFGSSCSASPVACSFTYAP